jgi:hypothetical protein
MNDSVEGGVQTNDPIDRDLQRALLFAMHDFLSVTKHLCD